MKEKEKVGCLFSVPTVLLMMVLFFPIGLILLAGRCIKKSAMKKQAKKQNELRPTITPVKEVNVPGDLLSKGNEIANNLKKELYCNKRDLPIDIFNATKWFWLLQLLVIAAYVYVIYTSEDFESGFLWTLLFIGAPWPIYTNIIRRTREVKESNRNRATYLRRVYQDTFNALVFSEYIERRLVESGIEHSEGDLPNSNDEEKRKFYHFSDYRKGFLRYKYSGQATEYVEGFSGFSFDNSVWKFGPFCYSVNNIDYDSQPKTAQMLFLSRKSTENEVVIFRKKSEFRLNEYEVSAFKKYEMDNFHFNEKFDIYAKNSIELFKVFTPAYMERILNMSEKLGVGLISIKGDCVEVVFDSKFPVLENSLDGYNVKEAIAEAEGVFQYFMQCMNIISNIGIN